MDPWTLFRINQNRASEDDNVQENHQGKKASHKGINQLSAEEEPMTASCVSL
jgi:hypothetical protein